jgi:hypothetical protein
LRTWRLKFLPVKLSVVVLVQGCEGRRGVGDFGRVNLAVLVGVKRRDQRRTRAAAARSSRRWTVRPAISGVLGIDGCGAKTEGEYEECC